MRYSAPLTRAQAIQLGKDVGMILGTAANALHHMHGINIDSLMRAFTTSPSVEVTAARYLRALEEDLSPGEAAARAATALVHDWADSVLETQRRLTSAASEEATQ
ncbi:hypothetical protein [Streptomyces roseochromogenus]|uniref:Uncharacterized protein n=1 Tax=Streptomyces roseochromogenus subsp. oscitans DS 12.976 TaxID=1352936 RepID=V6K465_STRRC|nr:hypothetical protein [Streptomyces roseochromogenus]EST26995.1 hypothetical protein M878_26235 [Streptomyces roseochromogenus subsp. oscitans DS 12.976]